jgi:hypothetical protein
MRTKRPLGMLVRQRCKRWSGGKPSRKKTQRHAKPHHQLCPPTEAIAAGAEGSRARCAGDRRHRGQGADKAAARRAQPPVADDPCADATMPASRQRLLAMAVDYDAQAEQAEKLHPTEQIQAAEPEPAPDGLVEPEPGGTGSESSPSRLRLSRTAGPRRGI